MKISDRISGIVEMCNYSSTIIDIGCDHAYISISLIKKNKCKNCIAVDINKLPLMNAIKNISDNNLTEYIQCIQSDGFNFLNRIEGDVSAVIAGMGGSTIAHILKQNMNKIIKMNYILIQPNSYARDIRKFLLNNNIHIEKEEVIFSEGVYYEYILIFPKSQEFLNEEYQKFLLNFDYDMPICILKNINGKYNEYINYRIEKYEKVLHGMKKSKSTCWEKYNVISNNILYLRGLLNEN